MAAIAIPRLVHWQVQPLYFPLRGTPSRHAKHPNDEVLGTSMYPSKLHHQLGPIMRRLLASFVSLKLLARAMVSFDYKMLFDCWTSLDLVQ